MIMIMTMIMIMMKMVMIFDLSVKRPLITPSLVSMHSLICFLCSGESTILIWKFSSRGRSMMQQKLDFLSTPDYSHGLRDWSSQETSINSICCNPSGSLVCASKGRILNIWTVSGGQTHVDTSHSHVMCITWPKVSESSLKHVRSKDALLLGRMDGSVAVVDVKDCMNFNRLEMEHCKREGNTSVIGHQ